MSLVTWIKNRKLKKEFSKLLKYVNNSDVSATATHNQLIVLLNEICKRSDAELLGCLKGVATNPRGKTLLDLQQSFIDGVTLDREPERSIVEWITSENKEKSIRSALYNLAEFTTSNLEAIIESRDKSAVAITTIAITLIIGASLLGDITSLRNNNIIS